MSAPDAATTQATGRVALPRPGARPHRRLFFLPGRRRACCSASPTSTSTPIGGSDNAALRRARATTRTLLSSPLFWNGAAQHPLLRAGRRAALGARVARRGAAAEREAGALQGVLPHHLLRAGRHHAGRGGDRLALPLPPALRPAELRRSARSGIGPIDWLGDPRWAMPAIILMAVWKNFGYNMLIFIAGLQSIPEELYEAAALDGAGAVAAVPARHAARCSAPTFLFVGVITMIGYFQLFAEPYVMTQGGPLRSTTSVVLLMYEEGFRWWRMGYAAAIAFVLFVHHRWRARWCSCALQPGRGRMSRRGARRPPARRARARRRAVALAPLLWMVSASLMPPGEANDLPAAAAAAARRRSSTTWRCSPASTSARHLLNSALIAVTVTAISLAGQRDGRLRLRQAPLPRARPALPACCPPGWSSRRRWRCCRSSCCSSELGLVNTLLGRDRSRTLASIFGIFLIRQYALGDSRRPARRRARSTARASSGSSGRSCCRSSGRSWSRWRSSPSSAPGTTSCGR